MSQHRPVIVVPSRHRPHEQLFMAWSALIGVVYLTTAPAPTSLSSTLPSWLLTVWAAGMAVSGATGLAGCWWRGERGLGIELGGLLMNAGALLMYAVAAFSVAGVRALLPGGIVAAWVAANLWRAAQIRRDLRSIRGGR